MSNRPSARDDPGRGFTNRREDESRMSDPSRSNNTWSRPPSRSYRPGPAQSRTPSPLRRFEPPDSRRGFGSGPAQRDRERDWDNRRREYDRDRDRERFRDYSPPRGRRPSPTRIHSPPRGPRASTFQSTAYTPSPRIPSASKAIPYQSRDGRSERPGVGGPGPSTIANHAQSQSQSIPPPLAPRSMRGSSSPVETRNTWSHSGPSSVPTRNVELPIEVKAEIDLDDLEEGEVVSPVRKPIEPPPIPRPGMGDRWAPSRRSLSPRRRRMVSRPSSPEFRNRNRDMGWRNSRRSMSPIVSRPLPDSTPARSIGREEPTAGSSQPRPPTPPVASALPDLKPPPRPETPLLPEKPPQRPSPVKSTTGRPKTPELPIPPKVEPPTEQQVEAITTATEMVAEDEDMTHGTREDVKEDSEHVPSEIKEDTLKNPESAPVDSTVDETKTPLDEPVLKSPVDPPIPTQVETDVDTQPQSSASRRRKAGQAALSLPVPVTARNEEADNDLLRTPLSPPVYQSTIAERRAVRLPESVALPSSRMRQGSMLSGRSASSQPETPQTADIRDDPLSGDLSDGALEEIYQSNIVAAVAQAQKVAAFPDPDSIFAWNQDAAPSPRLRETALIYHSEITDELDDMEEDNACKVLGYVGVEKMYKAAKVRSLRHEYKDHLSDWGEQHRLLTEQMQPRGPVPANVYYIADKPAEEEEGYQPDAAAEDGIARRGNRRDGLVANSDQAVQHVIDRSIITNARDPVAQSWVNKAAIPDMVLDDPCQYDDENDLVRNPLEFYDFYGQQEKIWTTEERAIFRRHFPGSMKQFGKISDKLPDKTTGDCVQYYYRTKKDLDWKGIVSKKSGGVGKKPKAAPPSKNKGPTLLNNPDKSRTATNVGAAGGRSTFTPARKGQGPRIRETVAGTPLDSGNRRRKQSGLDTMEGPGSEVTSRAGSEAPAVKSKMRMSIKGKRPRISSITGVPAASGSNAVPEQEAPLEGTPDAESSAPTPTRQPGDPQAELLPPAKRAGKRRKMADGAGLVEDKGDRPKRQSTSSYWSVDEKKAVGRLLTMFPDDYEKIAEHIAGKSVRQVQNFIASRGDMPDAGPVLSTSAYPYDLSSQQPRLGTFSDSHPTSPTKSQFRPGGMRISALLNDDTADSVKVGGIDTMDAASDGTVEDEGMTRPPSRSVPPRSDSTGTTYDRQPSTSTGYTEHYQRPYPGYQPQSQPLPQPQAPPHPGQPPPAGYYSNPSSRQYATGWDYPGPPPRHQQHQHPGLPPPSHHSHPHPNPHYPQGYPSHRPAPQMGTFAPPASNFGRTIYDSNRERGRGPAPPPQKDRNRSEGPAFTGFPPESRST